MSAVQQQSEERSATMEVRKARPEEACILGNLGAMAFDSMVDDWDWRDWYDKSQNTRLDPEKVYVIEEDGEARSTASLLPLEVFLDGRPVPMWGVAGVSTHPAYRRKGHAGMLMRFLLRVMREARIHLSLLDPSIHSFYRAYGWELVIESLRYTLAPTDLPTSPEQKRVRACREEDLAQMMALHYAEALNHTLFVRRGEPHWRKTLYWQKGDAAVYEGAEGVEGYVLYRLSGWDQNRAPHRTLNVRELVAASPGARAALISFMAAQDPNVFGIECSSSRGEPLHPELGSSFVDARVEPGLMLRLVDVEGALGLLRPTVTEPLVLQVSDDVLPENAGPYTVGDGEVIRGEEAAAKVSLDVRQLAQLHAGYLPARYLVRRGLIRPETPDSLELLEELFPPGDPWVSPPDYY